METAGVYCFVSNRLSDPGQILNLSGSLPARTGWDSVAPGSDIGIGFRDQREGGPDSREGVGGVCREEEGLPLGSRRLRAEGRLEGPPVAPSPLHPLWVVGKGQPASPSPSPVVGLPVGHLSYSHVRRCPQVIPAHTLCSCQVVSAEHALGFSASLTEFLAVCSPYL